MKENNQVGNFKSFKPFHNPSNIGTFMWENCPFVYENNYKPWLLKKRIDMLGVDHNNSLALHVLFLRWQNFNLNMIMDLSLSLLNWLWQHHLKCKPHLLKWQCWQKQLGLTKVSTCSCPYPTWKLASQAMDEKTLLQIATWVLIHLLSWAHHKRWMPIGSWMH